MPLSVPQHELLEVLRDGDERLVYRSRLGEQATVTRIIPGGPADLDGTLQPGDRIIAVAQGEGKPEDIIDLRTTGSCGRSAARRAPRCG